MYLEKILKLSLISSAVLVIVSRFGMESVSGSLIGIGIGDLVSSIFGALLVLFVPATIIVALKISFFNYKCVILKGIVKPLYINRQIVKLYLIIYLIR